MSSVEGDKKVLPRDRDINPSTSSDKVAKISWRVISSIGEMMKIKLEESDHGFMTSFESLFQKHEQMRHPLDQNEYDIETEIFNDSSYFMD